MTHRYTSAYLLNFFFLLVSFASFGGNAEGYYEFNTGSTCSTIDKNVTFQPVNAYFSPISESIGLSCEDNSNEYLTNSWAQGTEQFDQYYLEFRITAIAPFEIDGSNVSFDVRRNSLGPKLGKLYTSYDYQPWVQEGSEFSVSTSVTNISVSFNINTKTGGNIRFWLTFYDAQNSGTPSKLYIDNIHFEGTSPLPVELLSFQAVPDNSEVAISWVTASEVNNDYFTVERSKDGLSFETLTNMAGAGNSSIVNNYSVIDALPLSGTSYYKLRQTDFDGEQSYSNLVVVNINQEMSLSIYPNPTKGAVTISNIEPGSIASIINMQGSTVYRESIINQTAHIDLSSYSPGTYFVQVGEVVRKLVLQ